MNHILSDLNIDDCFYLHNEVIIYKGNLGNHLFFDKHNDKGIMMTLDKFNNLMYSGKITKWQNNTHHVTVIHCKTQDDYIQLCMKYGFDYLIPKYKYHKDKSCIDINTGNLYYLEECINKHYKIINHV